MRTHMEIHPAMSLNEHQSSGVSAAAAIDFRLRKQVAIETVSLAETNRVWDPRK